MGNAHVSAVLPRISVKKSNVKSRKCIVDGKFDIFEGSRMEAVQSREMSFPGFNLGSNHLFKKFCRKIDDLNAETTKESLTLAI